MNFNNNTIATARLVTVTIGVAMITTTTLTTLAYADHEAVLREMGLGYNDYDNDGVTCAATDQQADAWSDQFFNHHTPNIQYLVTCENKERSYAGLPPAADNIDHIQNLIDQWNSLYPKSNEK
jgi:hypothetical protein